MIKILWIIIIIAAVAGIVGLTAVAGVRRDEQKELFLRSAGVVEKFEQSRKPPEDSGQASPLVRQAQAFSTYLSPPPPAAPAGSRPGVNSPAAPRPPIVSAKFDLVGTCYYAKDPKLSLALIDEPGKGLRWVRQSAQVGHLIIDQIKDGVIVVRDGQKTLEIVAQRPQKRSLVKGEPPTGRAGIGSPQPAAAASSPAKRQNEEELMAQFINDLKAVKKTAGQGSSQTADANAINDFISMLENSRINGQEADKLDRLGERLQQAQPKAGQGKDAAPDANNSASNETPKNPADANQPSSGEPTPKQPAEPNQTETDSN